MNLVSLIGLIRRDSTIVSRVQKRRQRQYRSLNRINSIRNSYLGYGHILTISNQDERLTIPSLRPMRRVTSHY